VWTRVYEKARDILSNASDTKGRSIEIIDISEPDLSLLNLDEEDIQAVETPEQWSPVMSYVNYYLPNGGVIVPQFGDEKADDAAVEILRRVFGSDREVVPVYINELPLQGGGIHCATQQVPFTET
jgi:agmatine deiminase